MTRSACQVASLANHGEAIRESPIANTAQGLTHGTLPPQHSKMQLNLPQPQPTRLTVRRTSLPASVGCGRSDHARSRSCTLRRAG